MNQWLRVRRIGAIGVLGVALIAHPVGAEHGDMPRGHWPSPSNIPVHDRISSPNTAGAINAWNQMTPRVQMYLASQGGNPLDCNKVEGAVVICQDNSYPGSFGSTIDFGVNYHVGAKLLVVNQYDGKSMAMLVHELGHVVGLGHHTVQPGLSPMYRNAQGQPLMPQEIDRQALIKIYDHADTYSSQPYKNIRAVQRVSNGQVLDVPYAQQQDGVQLVQYFWGNHAHQRWFAETMGDGTFRLLNVHADKALDAFGNCDGCAIGQWEWHGGANQRWYIEGSGSGVRLRNKATNKCVSVAGGTQSAGAQIIQWGCHGGSDQIWSLPEV